MLSFGSYTPLVRIVIITNIINNIAQQILRCYFVLPLFALIMQYEFEISMHLNFFYDLKIVK